MLGMLGELYENMLRSSAKSAYSSDESYCTDLSSGE